MNPFIEKMRARRELWVKAGKFEFKLRRPTRLEIVKVSRDVSMADLLIPHFHDWRNVVENDLVGGGGTNPVAFDPAVWAEFIADRSELWPPLMDAFSKSLTDYTEQVEAQAKN